MQQAFIAEMEPSKEDWHFYDQHGHAQVQDYAIWINTIGVVGVFLFSYTPPRASRVVGSLITPDSRVACSRRLRKDEKLRCKTSARVL